MKKKLLILCVSILTIMCIASTVTFFGDGFVAVAAEAQTEVLSEKFSEGTYYYTVSQGEATITDADVKGDITIPEELGGYPVTAIGERAFFNLKKITSLVIPGCVKTLGVECFYNCSKLETLVIEEGVEIIGAYAFTSKVYHDLIDDDYNSSLKNVTLPDSIVELDRGAFEGTLLEGTVTLPKNLKLYKYPFSDTKVDTIIIPEEIEYSEDIIFHDNWYDCVKPKNIIIDENNDSYTIDENGFIYAEENKILVYSLDLNIKEMIVPETVEEISPYCFYMHKKLENIVLPENLKKIGYNAFSYCYGLKEVTLPDTVTDIGESAFFYCKHLQKINLPEGITEIKGGTFSHCLELSEINLPSTLTKIGEMALWYTGMSGELIVPENVRELDTYALGSGITRLKFLSNDLTLHEEALASCGKLTEIEFTPGNLYIDTQALPSTKNFVKLTLPEGNITLGEEVFFDTYIETLEFNSNNITIENVASNPDIYGLSGGYFAGRIKLETLIIGKDVSKINQTIFCMGTIKEIIVDSENPNYIVSEYVLYNKDMTELVRHFRSKEDSTVDYFVVPDTVKVIGPQAFRRADAHFVKLNHGLEVISEYAFYEHTVNVITIPETVTTIGKSAFGRCNGLYSVCYPKGEEEWNKISIGSGSGFFASADKYFYHEHSLTNFVYNNNSVYGEKDGTKTAYCDNGCQLRYSLVAEGTMNVLVKPDYFNFIAHTDLIYLYWDKYKPNDVTGYRVYLYDKETDKFTKIGTTKETSGVHRNLKSGTEYNYLVRTYKKLDDGTVVWSPYTKEDILVAGTLPEKTTGIKATQSSSAIKLTWKEVPGASGYRVYKYVEATGKYTKLGTVQKLNGTIKNLKPGTTYAYLVRAYKQLSDGTVLWADYSKDDVFYTSTKSVAPTLKATAGTKKFTLSWNKVAGAANYEIWYSTSANGTYKKLTTVTGTTYSKSCTTGRTYYFKVRAMKTVKGQTIKGEASTAKGVKIK